MTCGAQDAGRSGGLKLDKRKCAVSGMKKTRSQKKFTLLFGVWYFSFFVIIRYFLFL